MCIHRFGDNLIRSRLPPPRLSTRRPCAHRSDGQVVRQSTRPTPTRPNPGSRRTVSAQVRHQARELPHSEGLESSWYMERREPAPIVRWPRLETERQRVGDRCLVAHTTTPLLFEEGLSSRDRFAERSQIAPLIGFVERMRTIRRCIRCIDLCRAISSNQRAEGVIDELGITDRRQPPSRIFQEFLIDRGTDPNASHGINVASECHFCYTHSLVPGVGLEPTQPFRVRGVQDAAVPSSPYVAVQAVRNLLTR